jgi:type II secretory pathway pseudopilin PulG
MSRRRHLAGAGHGIPSFTLVEVLVAIAILSGLVLILANILGTTEKSWISDEAGEDSFREGRAALYVILHDLQSAHVSLNTPMVINDTDLYSGTTGSNPANLYFLVPLSQTAQGSATTTGDLCTVGYYIAYTADDSTDTPTTPYSYKLYRYFRPSAPAYTNLNSAQPPPFTSSNLSKLFTGIGPAPSDDENSTNYANGDVDEVLAHNVCNLQINWTTNLATVGASSTEDLTNTSTVFTNPAPVVVSISLDSLSASGAKMLQQGSDPQANWATNNAQYQRYAHTFSGQASVPPAQ